MELVNNEPQQPVRNTFLTIICILTFIGSGWGIVKSFQSYIAADFAATIVQEAMDEAQTKMDEQDEVPGFVKNIFGSITEGLSPANIRKMGLMEMISNVLTLIGGILMWNLCKSGFWIYVAGITFLMITPMVIFGNGLIGLIASGAAGFFGVIFIVLYAVNLKQMR